MMNKHRVGRDLGAGMILRYHLVSDPEAGTMNKSPHENGLEAEMTNRDHHVKGLGVGMTNSVLPVGDPGVVTMTKMNGLDRNLFRQRENGLGAEMMSNHRLLIKDLCITTWPKMTLPKTKMMR